MLCVSVKWMSALCECGVGECFVSVEWVSALCECGVSGCIEC